MELEKLPFAQDDKLATHLLSGARNEMVAHLLSDECNIYRSGFLTDNDILQIEKEIGRKVRCSAESGELFYKLD